MTIRKGKINWIHITNPKKEELEALRKEFKFHPVVLDQIGSTSAHSKVEIYDEYLFIVLHLPIYDVTERVSRKGEIDFLITNNTLISIQYEKLEPFSVIEEKIEDDPDYKDRLLGGDTARLLYYLIEAGVIFSLRQLRHIDEKVEDIRNNIFKHEDQQLLEKISYTKRDLLSYYLISKSQTGIFNSLDKIGVQFFGEKSKAYFFDLQGDFLKVTQLCENLKETIEAFEHTNAQLLTIHMTKVMQRFSVLAFLTFPIMVFLSLFSINTSSRPIVGMPYDFWILAGIVVFAIFFMTLIFKKKGWL